MSRVNSVVDTNPLNLFFMVMELKISKNKNFDLRNKRLEDWEKFQFLSRVKIYIISSGICNSSNVNTEMFCHKAIRI